jgi:hypothetical protein
MKIRAWFQKAAAKFAALGLGFSVVAKSVIQDLKTGIGLTSRFWSLYLQILILGSINVFLWLNGHGAIVGVREVIWITGKGFMLTIALIVGAITLLETYYFIIGKTHRKHGKEESASLVYYFSVGSISRMIDSLMLWGVIHFNFFVAWISASMILLPVCIHWILLYERFQNEGIDLMKIGYLRHLNGQSKKTVGEKILAWILRRRATIFIIGSPFFLDSEIVSLLLRKMDHFSWRETFKITLPSVFWGMAVLCFIFQMGVWGYKYFRWFVE